MGEIIPTLESDHFNNWENMGGKVFFPQFFNAEEKRNGWNV